MNHDRYLPYTQKKKLNSLNTNKNDQKRFLDEKNKRKIKEKPNNNNNKEKFIFKDRRTFNQFNTFNDYYNNDKFKSELNNDKEGRNEIKERKSIYPRNYDYTRTNNEDKKNSRNLNKINKNPAIINQQNNNINIYTNTKINKSNFIDKSMNPDLKNNINSGNYYIYGHSNKIDSSYEPVHLYKYNYNEENQHNKSNKNRTIDYNGGQVIQISDSNYKIGSNIINFNFKQNNNNNDNNIQYRLAGNKKLKNRYKPINNNIIYKTIDRNKNKNTNEEIYDYSDVKKRQYKEINNKKDNFENIPNEKANYNNKRRIVSIQMNNLGKYNFHKNNSSTTIYCSPKKMNLLDNKRTIDDKNFINYNDDNFDKQEERRNYKIYTNNNYIYKKNRNISCIKTRVPKRKLENVFKKENTNINENSIKSKNNSINKSKYTDLSFNSPTSTYSRKDERYTVSYLDDNNIINIKNIRNKNTNKRNEKRVEVNEIFNRNDRERSKYTTIQNSEDDIMSNNSQSKKNGKVVKRYYYQTVQGNANDKNNFNSYNIGNNDRTYKKKYNNIIYENNVNSFDRNSEKKKINYDEEDYRDNLSHYNYKINNFSIKSPTISEMNSEKANINDIRKRNNNRKNTFNENCKISKTIRTKKIITDSIPRKKFSNSFNNELIDNDNDSKKNNYNGNNNLSKVNNYAQKNCNKLILTRGLNINTNLYLKAKSELYQNLNPSSNNGKKVNTSLYEKTINFTGKSSPKAHLYSYNENSPSPTKLTQNDELLNDYFYSNSKTIEDFHKKKDSMESSPKTRKNILYHKKRSQNHYDANNPRMSNDLNNEFNKTFYLKNYMGENIYHKKNLKNKMSDFSTTTENKTLKKEQTDNYSINSSHNSNNNKNINNSNNTNINTYSNKKNNINNISISIIENEDSIKYSKENSYCLNELKDKANNNTFCFFKKLYSYHVKKPQIKLYYVDKCKMPKIIDKNENIKGINSNSINISNISENKNNDYNSFSISFNNNKNKKCKEIIEDMSLNLKNLNLDSDSKIISEENIFGSSNDKNKIPIIKKNEDDFINNDCLNFEFSDEKEDKINLSKNENDFINKKINNNIKKPEEEKNRYKKNLQINLDNNYIGNNLYSNYISNSTSKKGNSLCKWENINKTNDINEKVSLLTKKLTNIFNKKNSHSVNIENNNIDKNTFDINKKSMNISIHDYNDKKQKKIRKSLTEKEFVLGYSKLNNIFCKKNSSSNINSTYTLKGRSSNIINNKIDNLLNNRIEEEINDSELNENIIMKQKAKTHKMKQKNNLLEDENKEEKTDNEEENKSKKDNLESTLSYNNSNLQLKDNILNEKVKLHTNNLGNKYSRTCKVNSTTIRSSENIENKIKMKINRYLNLLKDYNISFVSEQLINVILLNDKKKIIDKYIGNINLFVNIIFDRLINEKNKIDLYALICNKLNLLLSEYDSSELKEEFNLGNIIKNEFLKRINNKEYFNYIYLKDFDYVKSKLLLLIYFIFKIISFNLINLEEGFNIISKLFNSYENIKDKDKKKYIYLEGSVYLYELLRDLIQKLPKKVSNILILAKRIEDNLRKSLKDEDIPQNLNEKIIEILEKKDKIEKKSSFIENILYSPLKINSLNEKEKNNISNDKIHLINIVNDEKKEESEINYNFNNTFQKIENKIENDDKNNLIDNNKFDDLREKIKGTKNNENNENTHKNGNINRLRKHYKINTKLEEQNETNNKNTKYRNTNCNFYNEYNKLISKRQDTIQNNEFLTENNMDRLYNKNEDSENKNKTYNVTHKRKQKSKKKSKSSEKRKFSKSRDELYKKIESEEEKINKDEIRKDLENYLKFLEKEGVKNKEDIYEELNDSYNWKTIDNLIMGKNLKLEEIIKIYIEICKNKKDFKNNDLFKANEYIKTIIEYYTNNLSKNQTEILHLNMIEIYMAIDNFVDNSDSLYMYEIMGNLLFVLIKNKLYYMKDLNNFIEKSNETQINIAKVVKYTIIASGNSSKQYHNDFKFTKLFNNNDIFTLYVTKELYGNKNK